MKNKNDKGSDSKMTKIAIDAGHGSQTAGKRTPDGFREHWINVKTAYYCEQYLKSKGIETVRIGWNDTNSKDDADVSLSTRQKQIKNAKCDYSVSCHANAFGDGKTYNSASGVSTHIHSNLAYLNDSLRFSQCIQKRLVEGTKQKDRGVVRQSLAMCNCKTMGTKASCLVEIAFMTNKAEADLMKTDAFCKEQGEDIAKGICDYLGIKNSTTASSSTVIGSSNTSSILSTANTYIVQKGDTLSDIGSKTGIDWKTIADLNEIKTPYVIKVGQVLKLTMDNPNSSSSPTVSKKFMFNGLDYSLVFDPIYYTNKYPDLKKVFGANSTALFDHFCTYGMQEGRIATANFNVNVYKNTYADLRNAFGNNLPLYYKHYITNGYKEKRKCV